jgi:hypothetical protein
MKNTDSDFDSKVLDYLYGKKEVERWQLKRHLMKSHPNETGYSEPNIDRKLANMVKAGKIFIKKDPDELAKYGIKKADGRVSYVFPMNVLDRMGHLNHVYSRLKTGDIIVKEASLDEIQRYENKCVFTPDHLDILVLNLDLEEVKFLDKLLQTLYNQIINKEVKPRDKDLFLENLRSLLERYPEGHRNFSMLRRRIIWLLGYYNNKAVLEQLIKDTESGKLSIFQNDYMDRFTARVIENGRTELYELEIRLKKKGDTETIRILDEIRKNALANLDEPIEPNKTWEEVVGSQVSKPIIKGKIKGIKK